MTSRHHRLGLVALSTLVLTSGLGGCDLAEPDLGPPYEAVGIASWYGPNYAGRLTANGEIFDPAELTAAHLTLRFGTILDVTHVGNGRTVRVRINDRGPYIDGRIIDLSQGAAEVLGMIDEGIATVGIVEVRE